MELQKVFKHSYMDELRKNIHVSDYQGEVFPYEPSKVKTLANVYKPEGLEQRLIDNIDNEYRQAIELFEAYPTLNPLVASMDDFWVTLTHTDLFGFVKLRWPDIVEHQGKVHTEEEQRDYIIDHWFRSTNGVMRTTLMGLWWSVYCSYDDKADDEHKYDLTKVLFSRADFRVRRLGSSTLMRHKEAVLGILQFIKDNEDFMDEYFEGRAIYISKYFNGLGGTKPLVYLKRDFFYNELVKHKAEMSKILTRKDILNK